jgi:hypothetical protein
MARQLEDLLRVHLLLPFSRLDDINVTIAQLYYVPTRMFSQKETPLIGDVLGCIEEIRSGLSKARECTDMNKVHNTLRIAAHAGHMVLEKYIKLLDVSECEVHAISIGT